MSIVTLTTDLGYRDPYLALVKARFYTSNSNIQLVDLSCELKGSSITQTAYILKNSLSFFPSGTIHLVAIKFIADKSRNNSLPMIDNSRFLLTQFQNQFVISPDNGLFSLIDSQFKEKVYQIYYEEKHKQHFFLKDIFADVALHLSNGGAIEEVASQTNDYSRSFQFEYYVSDNSIRGKGIYLDDFGNIVCNIMRTDFEKIIGNKKFEIVLPGARITKISTTYDDVSYGSPLVFFNIFGYLELAINGGNAYKMFCPREIGAHFDFNLLIKYYD